MKKMDGSLKKIKVIDSHTCGEPTRVIISGGPNLGKGSMQERVQVFKLKHDTFRSAIVNEPRGSEIIVGALLCEPSNQEYTTGVIFFNNIGYLGMCGHGTIGVVKTLHYMGSIKPGLHLIETPVGLVRANLHTDGKVSIINVPSYRFNENVEIEIEKYGRMTGDVAWGGNWFFLTEDQNLDINIRNINLLTKCAVKIREYLFQHGITGKNGAVIDHIELFGPPSSQKADSKNFVLCPGNTCDRSPCGTGTSAKMICLYERGMLPIGKTWRQESIIGSIFECELLKIDKQILPKISAYAHITGECTLIIDSTDPYPSGINIFKPQ